MLSSLLLSILPTFLLHGLKAWLTAYTSAEQTKREVALATINGVIAVRQAQAAVIETGMGHTAFWVPWTIAAVSAAVWYAWGMIDSAWPGHLPHVAALPPQLLDLTDRIWDSLFLSGSIALGGTNIAKAIKTVFAK